MKPSSICFGFMIAASNLSAIALAFSQPSNIANNLESQSPQISKSSTEKIAGKTCNITIDPLCGWWIIIEDLLG